MTESIPTSQPAPAEPPAETQTGSEQAEAPVSVLQILKENWILTRALIFFILMLSVPLLIAWKFDLFLVANN